MADYTLNYGHSTISLSLDKSRHIEWLLPSETPGAANPEQTIRKALDNPLEDCAIERFGTVRTVAIAINDKTRPVPHNLLLPPLLHKLESLGVLPEGM